MYIAQYQHRIVSIVCQIDANFGREGYQYIDGANTGAWGADKVQLLIDGYGLRARGQNIDISVKKPV